MTKANPGDAVGGIVERIVYGVFMTCDLNAVGRLGIEKGRVYKARRTVRERMKSEDDIHSGERTG